MRLFYLLPFVAIIGFGHLSSKVEAKGEVYTDVSADPGQPASGRVGYKNGGAYGKVSRTGGLPPNYKVGYEGNAYGSVSKTEGQPAHFQGGYREGGGYVQVDKTEGEPAQYSAGYQKDFRGGHVRAGIDYTEGDKEPNAGVTFHWDL